MMKWFDWILTALRSAARDLISEDDEIEGDRIDTLIDAAQTRLVVLRDELRRPSRARNAPRSNGTRPGIRPTRWIRMSISCAPGQTMARAHIEQASGVQVKADE